MPVKPKDSRLIGWGRVKPRPQRLPKVPPMPEGIKLAEDSALATKLSYNPPMSSLNPLITPTAFLPAHLRDLREPTSGSQAHDAIIKDDKASAKILTPEEVAEIKSLRSAGKSRKEIASLYSTTPFFVSLVAPLDKIGRASILLAEQASKARWSERKQIYREIRANRKASWGYTS